MKHKDKQSTDPQTQNDESRVKKRHSVSRREFERLAKEGLIGNPKLYLWGKDGKWKEM